MANKVLPELNNPKIASKNPLRKTNKFPKRPDKLLNNLSVNSDKPGAASKPPVKKSTKEEITSLIYITYFIANLNNATKNKIEIPEAITIHRGSGIKENVALNIGIKPFSPNIPNPLVI